MHTPGVILHVLSSEFSSLVAQTATAYPTMRFISPNGSLSPPEPKRHADNVAVAGLLTPGDAVLNFHYLINAPTTPSMFQCIISGEKGALKMEGKSFLLCRRNRRICPFPKNLRTTVGRRVSMGGGQSGGEQIRGRRRGCGGLQGRKGVRARE